MFNPKASYQRVKSKTLNIVEQGAQYYSLGGCPMKPCNQPGCDRFLTEHYFSDKCGAH